MEFTRYRHNRQDPDPDPFFPDNIDDIDDNEFIDLIDNFQLARHAAFPFIGVVENHAVGQENEAGFASDYEQEYDQVSEDEESENQDSEGQDSEDQDSDSERDVGVELDGVVWQDSPDRASIASSASQRSSSTVSESVSDSDSPGSHQSPSSAESAASPSNASTASEDSLFVTQGEHDIELHARLYVHEQEQIAEEFLFFPPYSPGDRLHRRIDALRRRNMPTPGPPPPRPAQLIDSPEDDDELFEMEIAGWRRALGGRANPPESVREPAAPVIDLTNEPDSPEEISASRFHRNRAQAAEPDGLASTRHRNRRRQQSFGRTPSLSRSDGSLLGAAPVIDLTMEDDDMEPGPLPNRRPAVPARRPPPVPSFGARAPANRRPAGNARQPIDLVVENPDDEDPSMFGRFFRRFGRSPGAGSIESMIQLLGGNAQLLGGNAEGLFLPAPAFAEHMERVANPLGNNMPNFNYRGNGYNNQGDPKPPFVPPPQARPGFGRNTAEDLAFVCPSCEEELKYDPDAEAAKARPAKKARNRKDREEHHFWAVKECGHVYCKKCFDERRPSKKYSGPPKTKFRPVDQKTILCAIEDCTSDVGPKGNWVGLFL